MLVSSKSYQILDESGGFILKGKGTEANVPNGNTRVYPVDILKPAFLEMKSSLDENIIKVYSNLEHPKDPEPIKSPDAVGIVTSMEWVDDHDYGVVTINIDESLKNGKDVIEAYRSGERLGVSHRARGTLDESTGVVTSMKLFSFDVTVVPSCQTCMLDLNESKSLDVYEVEHGFDVIDESIKDETLCPRKSYLVDSIKELISKF